MLAASLAFALMSAIAKWLSRDFGTVQQVFFRNIFGAIFIGISLIRRPAVQTGGRPWMLLSRGVIGTLALYLLFYSIRTLGLGQAIVFQYTYPVFLALMSWILIGEKLIGKDWLAIALGLAGILLIFRPEMSLDLRNQAIGIGNALLTATAYFAVRQLTTRYDARVIVLSFMLSGIVLPILSMTVGTLYPELEEFDFLLGTFQLPRKLEDWLAFTALGVFALIGQVLMTRSFAYGKSGKIAAAGYSSILFATLIGLYMGEQIPSMLMLLGMVLIIAGGLLVSFDAKSPRQE